MRADKNVISWLYIGMAMILIMVVIGGITRLTDSGLSIVDWKLLMGSLPPLNDVEWQASFEKYQQSPQFKELNNHFTLAEYKNIFWWEYIHRLWGRIIGLVFFIPFIIFLIQKRIENRLLKHLIFVMILGAFQAFLGWYMVKSGLIHEPRVSHFRLAAHLLTAFGTISYIYILILKLQKKALDFKHNLLANKYLAVFITVLVFQIIYGAFVAGLDAGLMFNTWPLINGFLAHPSVISLEPFIINFIENKAAIQFVHRTTALILLVLGFVLWYKTQKMRVHFLQKKAVSWVLALLSLQFILGVFTLLWSVPLALGVLHQVVALLLLLSSIRAYFFFRQNVVVKD